MNSGKLKYYSFNFEKNNQLDEGFTEDKPNADYDSTNLNSTVIDLAKNLKFKNDYYKTFQDVKIDYVNMINAISIVEHDVDNSINDIYNTMLENNGSDINETSVKLGYIENGEYDKRIVNGFINKINEEYLSNHNNISITGVKLPNLE